MYALHVNYTVIMTFVRYRQFFSIRNYQSFFIFSDYFRIVQIGCKSNITKHSNLNGSGLVCVDVTNS